MFVVFFQSHNKNKSVKKKLYKCGTLSSDRLVFQLHCNISMSFSRGNYIDQAQNTCKFFLRFLMAYLPENGVIRSDKSIILVHVSALKFHYTIQCFTIPSGVESYLARGKDGQLGITGEGSMLDNAAGLYICYIMLLVHDIGCNYPMYIGTC